MSNADISKYDSKAGYIIAAHNMNDIDPGIYTTYQHNTHVIERAVKPALRLKKGPISIRVVTKGSPGENIDNFFKERNKAFSTSEDKDLVAYAEDFRKNVNIVNFKNEENSIYCVAETASNIAADFIVLYDGTSYFKNEHFGELEKIIEKMSANSEIKGYVLSAPREFEGASHYLTLNDAEEGLTNIINGGGKEKEIEKVNDTPMPSIKVPIMLICPKSVYENLRETYNSVPEKKNEVERKGLSIVELMVNELLKDEQYKGKIKHMATSYNFMDIRTANLEERAQYTEFAKKWGQN
jgi:hypothetical protein